MLGGSPVMGFWWLARAPFPSQFRGNAALSFRHP